MPPFKLIPTVSKNTVKTRLQPVYETTAKQIAGPNCPIVLKIFLVEVILSRLLEINQSAIVESTSDAIHIPRYGTDERNPFCERKELIEN